MRGVASEIRPRLSGRCRLKGIDDRRALISSLFLAGASSRFEWCLVEDAVSTITASKRESTSG